MKPSEPKVANAIFGPPSGLEESQVRSIPAFVATVPFGPVEGIEFCVVAWKLEEGDLEQIRRNGGNLYLSVLSRLVPHFLTTSFEEATYGIVKDENDETVE